MFTTLLSSSSQTIVSQVRRTAKIYFRIHHVEPQPFDCPVVVQELDAPKIGAL